MQHVTLCLPINADGAVLLGLKLRGFGQGKVVGVGGKVEPGETLAAAAARELHEEAGLMADPSQLEPVARLTFLFPTFPRWNHLAHVFTVRIWQGAAIASDEVAPQWFAPDALPLDRMWDDGRYWLPRVLAGERLDMTCTYGPDLATVAEVTSREFQA